MPNLCVCNRWPVGRWIADRHHFRIVADRAISDLLLRRLAS
jgi:hypothetical protein